VDQDIFNQLHTEGLISDESLRKIEQKNAGHLFSVHWEVKTLLYVGILLLTTGLGILVYKNIDSIGHQFVLLFIALITAGCFAYCFKNKMPFNAAKVQSLNSVFDYLLLLGTLSFLIFVGYLQYQYNVFGNNYGMATFIPMLALFYIAYSFDHAGILNMAITNLGIWMGVSVTPKQLLAYHTFNSETIIYTYLGFGIILLIAAWLTEKFSFKKHFKFSYQHYGIHICFITLLAGYFHNYDEGLSLLWLLGLLILAVPLFVDAYMQKSFYFLLLIVLYSFIAVSSLVMRGLATTIDGGGIYLIFMYFICSAVGLVSLLIYLNKKLKAA
jgi:hypothetical protein